MNMRITHAFPLMMMVQVREFIRDFKPQDLVLDPLEAKEMGVTKEDAKEQQKETENNAAEERRPGTSYAGYPSISEGLPHGGSTAQNIRQGDTDPLDSKLGKPDLCLSPLKEIQLRGIESDLLQEATSSGTRAPTKGRDGKERSVVEGSAEQEELDERALRSDADADADAQDSWERERTTRRKWLFDERLRRQLEEKARREHNVLRQEWRRKRMEEAEAVVQARGCSSSSSHEAGGGGEAGGGTGAGGAALRQEQEEALLRIPSKKYDGPKILTSSRSGSWLRAAHDPQEQLLGRGDSC
jgi:hypothetical protein